MGSASPSDDSSRTPFDAFARSIKYENLDLVEAAIPWTPLPHQEAPSGDWWTYWLLLGGRGSGKTDAGAAWVDELATAQRIRAGIVAPTLGDARAACVEGPSGLLAHNPAIRFDRQLLELHWPNGSYAKCFGAYTPEDVERLRAGGNRHFDWYEEIAAWRQLEPAWDMARLGLRMGAHPRAVLTTTPKPRRLFLGGEARAALLERKDIAVTHATTDDNPHLSRLVRDTLEELYGGTRMGRQELAAEWLTDLPGALWQWHWIEDYRVAEHPPLSRVVVAVDPALMSGEESHETGIVAAGLGLDGDYYVLDAQGYRLSPAGWADRTFAIFDEHEGDLIVAERNAGGEMVEATLRQVRRSAPIRLINATRGKTLRAEPISRLYEKGKVHHVGLLPRLEEQYTEFGASAGWEADDIVDAAVHALTELSSRAARTWGAA